MGIWGQAAASAPQLAETKDGEIIGGTLLYVAYFNAGLRIVEIADPYHPREVGFFIA